jgi:hypothetical protein
MLKVGVRDNPKLNGWLGLNVKTHLYGVHRQEKRLNIEEQILSELK